MIVQQMRLLPYGASSLFEAYNAAQIFEKPEKLLQVIRLDRTLQAYGDFNYLGQGTDDPQSDHNGKPGSAYIVRHQQPYVLSGLPSIGSLDGVQRQAKSSTCRAVHMHNHHGKVCLVSWGEAPAHRQGCDTDAHQNISLGIRDQMVWHIALGHLPYARYHRL